MISVESFEFSILTVKVCDADLKVLQSKILCRVREHSLYSWTKLPAFVLVHGIAHVGLPILHLRILWKVKVDKSFQLATLLGFQLHTFCWEVGSRPIVFSFPRGAQGFAAPSELTFASPPLMPRRFLRTLHLTILKITPCFSSQVFFLNWFSGTVEVSPVHHWPSRLTGRPYSRRGWSQHGATTEQIGAKWCNCSMQGSCWAAVNMTTGDTEAFYVVSPSCNNTHLLSERYCSSQGSLKP